MLVSLELFFKYFIYESHGKFLPHSPQWGTADAEIKDPPGGNQGLSKVPSF